MDAPEARDSWLTPAETAALFGVVPRTLINWDLTGKLRAAQRTAGGHRRWRESDAQALLAELRAVA